MWKALAELSYFYRQLCAKEMVRRYGENFDWRKGPIDPEALHASGGGKAHGR